MNNNSANVVEDGAVKLPIEKKYQKDIQKWLKDTMAETGLPIERKFSFTECHTTIFIRSTEKNKPYFIDQLRR